MPGATDLETGVKQERALATWEADNSQMSGLVQPGAGPAAHKSMTAPGRNLQDGRQVGIKLGLCFGLLIAILMGTAYLALDRMQRMYAGLQADLDEGMLELQLAQDGIRYSDENSRIIMELFLVQQPEVIDQLLAHRAENSRKISALIPVLEKQCESDEEKRLLETVKETRSAYVDSYQRALNLLLVKKDRNAATDVMLERTYPTLLQYHEAWSQFERFQFDQVKDVAEKGKQHHATTRRVMLGLDFMVALLAGGIALIASRRVAHVVDSRIRVQREVHRLNAELEQRVTHRTLELQRTENRLRGSLGDLQEYTSRVETLNQLVELLQSCLTPEEGYRQAARVLAHFFPEGTLLMLNPSRNLLDLVCSWESHRLGRGLFPAKVAGPCARGAPTSRNRLTSACSAAMSIPRRPPATSAFP